jgi:GAF domain-containing protein
LRSVSGLSDERSMRIAVAFAREVVKGREAHLCAACAGVLSVSGAGLSIMSERHSGRMCVSNSRMEALEDIQFTLGEGPCQDAYATGVPLLVPQLDQVASARWPAFIAEAVAVGVHAVFAYPLMNRGAKVGVMTLYQDRPGALSPAQGADCLAVADVVAATMLGLIAASPPGSIPAVLDEAVAHRAEVHQATGMVSAQLDISVADSLARIRAYAYATGQSIRVVATDIVARRLRLDEGDGEPRKDR